MKSESPSIAPRRKKKGTEGEFGESSKLQELGSGLGRRTIIAVGAALAGQRQTSWGRDRWRQSWRPFAEMSMICHFLFFQHEKAQK